MQETSLSNPQGACTFCRKRKRACDRRLPGCSTCASRGQVCDYSNGALLEDAQYLTAPVSLFTPPNGQTFPEAYFLDHRAFLQRNQSIPSVQLIASAYFDDLIGDPQSTVAEYFARINWWMPIVSRTRLLASLKTAEIERKATEVDLVLLLLAMEVLLWNPSTQQSKNPRTKAYLLARHFINEAVVAGAMSCRLLQAQILLAIFELGHAMYPAAYLSVGACARYGIAMGANATLRPDFPLHHPSMDLLEIEEQKRTWWMVLILDRFTQLGNPQRPLSTADPTGDSLLPCDEERFDRGDIPDQSFPVSAAANVKMGMLARMCQATYLLGHVLQYNQNVSDPEHIAGIDDQTERELLDKTIHALLNLSYIEGEIRRTAVCAQTSICYSALIALHDPKSARVDQQHMKFAIDMLKPVIESMSWDSGVFLSGYRVSVADASPLLLVWAYEASAIYNRLSSRYEKETLFLLSHMRLKLSIMSQRWLAGAAYLELLEADSSTKLEFGSVLSEI